MEEERTKRVSPLLLCSVVLPVVAGAFALYRLGPPELRILWHYWLLIVAIIG